jgi:hypothetical protein
VFACGNPGERVLLPVSLLLSELELVIKETFLAIAANIIKNHNGFIDVSSTLGKGTQFQIFFPVASFFQIGITCISRQMFFPSK